MKRFLRWSISNSPAMNIIMTMVIGVGLFCCIQLRRETFPEFDLEMISISVPFPGATPEEVEEGICQKIEEELSSIDYVKKMTSTASEGAGSVMLELSSNVPDVDRTLNEVRTAVERIPSFPELAEKPVVQRAKMQEMIIQVAVLGPDDDSPDAELAMRELTEEIRDELLLLPSISNVSLVGAKDYQIDIEIPESTLRSHGLSLQEVSRIVQNENIKTPGGTLRASSEEINIRTDNRRYHGDEIAELPIIAQEDGSVLRLEDLGYVRDQFVDTPGRTYINRKPAFVLGVQRNTSEDLLKMVDEVNEYVASRDVPAGYEMITLNDRSTEVRDRLSLLFDNGLQGLLIVFLLLAIFLEIRLAFWVAMGIPFAIFVTGGWLEFTGGTLNMMSTFAIIMALGIVVDDAIVVGENIFAHRQKGSPLLKAAVDGTAEVLPSVAASVTTTVIAFSPLLFVSGMMGKFIAVIPVAIIAMLLGSLFECLFILPCHLSHQDSAVFRVIGVVFYIFRPFLWLMQWINRQADRALMWFIKRCYTPALHFVLRWRAPFLVSIVGLLAVGLMCVRSGIVPFVFFPKIDANQIQMSVSFPNGTPSAITEKWTRHAEDVFWDIAEGYEAEGQALASSSLRAVGMSVSSRGRDLGGSLGGGQGHKGSVTIELVSGDDRTVSSMDVVQQWRKAVGVIPGAEEVKFQTQGKGPGGADIEITFLADKKHDEQLQTMVELCKKQLAEYPGVTDIADSDMPGKWEYRIRVKEEAFAMGVRPMDLANTIRATYFGAESMRIQRGRHEVKVMVCYPRDERNRLASLEDIRIQTADGSQRPLTEIADIEVVRGYTSITRHNRLRSITVQASVDDAVGNSAEIVAELKNEFLPKQRAEMPGVSVLWQGRQEQQKESFGSMFLGFMIALLGMYTLLAMEFRSYVQPLLVLVIIPFGAIGAIAGHALMGHPISFFSVFGLVALSGIVVNDSIVLIDFINHNIESGNDATHAVCEAGKRRFRPVMLTSATTIGGLLPILAETSLQAQMLIPMAISIAFGVMFATVLVLFMMPVLYSLYAHALAILRIDIRNVLNFEDQEETQEPTELEPASVPTG